VCGRNDGQVAHELADKVRAEHIAADMEDVEMRERAGQRCPESAVSKHIGEIAGHIAHVIIKGAHVAGLRLGFGVLCVAPDGDVDAYEAVDYFDVVVDVVVGAVVGGVEAWVGEAEVVGKDGVWHFG